MEAGRIRTVTRGRAACTALCVAAAFGVFMMPVAGLARAGGSRAAASVDPTGPARRAAPPAVQAYKPDGCWSTHVPKPGDFRWTDWKANDLDPGPGFKANGVIKTPTAEVTVTYTNPNGIGFYQPDGGTDWISRKRQRVPATSPYTSALVPNIPTCTDLIALSRKGTQTLEFSQPIATPVFAFVSLNGNGYAFDQDFEILSVGGVDGKECGYWGCGGVSKVIVDRGNGVKEYQLNSNNVGGGEPHGTIRFTGTSPG